MGKPTDQPNNPPTSLKDMNEGMQAVILRGMAASILTLSFPKLEAVEIAFDQFGMKLIHNSDLVQAFDGSADLLQLAENKIRAHTERLSKIKSVIASGNNTETWKLQQIVKILAEP